MTAASDEFYANCNERFGEAEVKVEIVAYSKPVNCWGLRATIGGGYGVGIEAAVPVNFYNVAADGTTTPPCVKDEHWQARSTALASKSRHLLLALVELL